MNPDQQLLRAFIAEGEVPLAFSSSAMAQALEGHLVNANPEKGVVALCFKPPALFLQGNGVVQGGAVASMLDFAMALTALLVMPDGYSAATTNLNLVFLRSVKAGQSLLAEGYLERRGRSLVFSRAELKDEHGVLLATATSTLAVLPPPA